MKHFVDYLGGKKGLPNDGAIIAATSRSHNLISKSIELMILQNQERQVGMEISHRNPFERDFDLRAEEALRD